MTGPDDLAARLGVKEEQGIGPKAEYMRVALDALEGAGFQIVSDQKEAAVVFVWIAIHDYETFGALNSTAGLASGRLFKALDAMEMANLLTRRESEHRGDITYTERGRLAAYLVRATLEDFASGPGSES